MRIPRPKSKLGAVAAGALGGLLILGAVSATTYKLRGE